MKSASALQSDSVSNFKQWIKQQTGIPIKNLHVTIRPIRGMRCYCLETSEVHEATEIIMTKQSYYKIEVASSRVLLCFPIKDN